MTAYPWRQYMQAAFGLLGWDAGAFWAATPQDVRLACEARHARHPGSAAAPLTRGELRRMMEREGRREGEKHDGNG